MNKYTAHGTYETTPRIGTGLLQNVAEGSEAAARPARPPSSPLKASAVFLLWSCLRCCVFDAFHTTKSSGMGMGLSISRSIIDAHGGRLWAEANEPRGTIFQFTLPALQVGS